MHCNYLVISKIMGTKKASDLSVLASDPHRLGPQMYFYVPTTFVLTIRYHHPVLKYTFLLHVMRN